MLDARPIGGGRLPYSTKSEATVAAKELFERWANGNLVAAEAEWTLDTAVKKYIATAASRVHDANDRYGPHHARNQKLEFICNLKLAGLRFGQMKVELVCCQ